jgi:hypothetical protein
MKLKSFHYILKSFVIYKTLVDIVFFNTFKIECDFCYSNFQQMF